MKIEHKYFIAKLNLLGQKRELQAVGDLAGHFLSIQILRKVPGAS